MKVSLSASKAFEPKQRVAVEFDKNEWYIGTVVKATPTGHRIEMDFGGTQLIKNEIRTVAVTKNAKVKKSFTLAQIRELKSVKATKVAPAKAAPAPKRIRITLDAKPLVAEKPPIVKDVPKVDPTSAPIPPTHTAKDTQEELSLEHKYGNARLFAKCTSGTVSQIRANQLVYLTHVWNNANKGLFDSKLIIPKISLLKAMKNFRGLGYWRASTRDLKISPRMFNASQAQIVTTLVHEMCHQAVSEIDHVRDRTAGGHGPNWIAWMRKCGLDAHRYNTDDRTDFMSDSEKADVARKTANRQRALETVQNKHIPSYKLREDMPAQYHSPGDNVWVKGLIVGKHDQAGKRWCFIASPVPSWKMIPSEWFYEIDPSEHATFTTDAFLAAAARIRFHKDMQLAQRRVKADRRNTLRGMFG